MGNWNSLLIPIFHFEKRNYNEIAGVHFEILKNEGNSHNAFLEKWLIYVSHFPI